jgi:membrane fusion protein (multidrug efflux system)
MPFDIAVSQTEGQHGMDEQRSDASERRSDQGDDGREQSGESEHKSGFLRRPIVRISIVVVLALVLIGALVAWHHARKFESTDDAFIDTHVVRLSPQIAGRVARVDANDNAAVHAGQVLVEIDAGEVRSHLDEVLAEQTLAQSELEQAQAQVRSSEAAYAQALSSLESAAAQAENAARELERLRSLKASTPQAVAQAQLDAAEAAARSAAAQRDAAGQRARSAAAAVAAARAQAAGAQARVEALAAQIALARLNLGYTRVAAPIDGYIAQRSVAAGNYVSPGQQMMAIVPPQMWVTANFKETQLVRVRLGQRVDIKVDACPGTTMRGHVDSIQRGAGQAFALLPPENATGNFVKVVQRVPVKIVFDTLARECPLGPGMSVVPTVTVR